MTTSASDCAAALAALPAESQADHLAEIAAALQAQTHLIQALAITQTDHTRVLREIRQALAEHAHLLRHIAASVMERGPNEPGE